MISGNHDWEQDRSDGLQAILLQQAHLDSLHLPNTHWLPRNLVIQIKSETMKNFIIRLPFEKLEWFQVFKEGDKTYVVFIEDILKRNLHWIFPQAWKINVFSFAESFNFFNQAKKTSKNRMMKN